MHCLFWNIGKLSDLTVLEEVCTSESIDVLLTSEDHGSATAKFLAGGPLHFHQSLSPTPRGIKYYSKPGIKLDPVIDDAYLSAKSISHSQLSKLLIILIHYPSKMYMSEKDQSAFAAKQSQIIDKIEGIAKTEHTLIVGDFNINPHEDAMLSASGLNAVCCLNEARRGMRKVKNVDYRFFYNPMWQFYTKPSRIGHGTFYSNPYGYQSVYWNIFDQVIFRPSVADYVSNIRILESLVSKKGAPTELLTLADHLPIAFELKL